MHELSPIRVEKIDLNWAQLIVLLSVFLFSCLKALCKVDDIFVGDGMRVINEGGSFKARYHVPTEIRKKSFFFILPTDFFYLPSDLTGNK